MTVSDVLMRKCFASHLIIVRIGNSTIARPSFVNLVIPVAGHAKMLILVLFVSLAHISIKMANVKTVISLPVHGDVMSHLPIVPMTVLKVYFLILILKLVQIALKVVTIVPMKLTAYNVI